MAQHTLDIDSNIGVSLFGIASHARPYQLVGQINGMLNMHLAHSGKGISLSKKNDDVLVEHPYFIYNDVYNSCQYYLYVNFFNQRYLLPKLKHAHYLLLVTCEAYLLKERILELKKCPKVLSFFDLNQHTDTKTQIYQWTL